MKPSFKFFFFDSLLPNLNTIDDLIVFWGYIRIERIQISKIFILAYFMKKIYKNVSLLFLIICKDKLCRKPQMNIIKEMCG
ncbi:hypothetical protein EFY79_02995 [Hanamia caeni]|uniref:Uncharacterized protein n=1 Tax=Hanamia caeni TaxID=2294116 RepID=A0A3M9NR32_9BACT|nr:hypothetical protein EFY79_02995 [Hanamia caeni]